jgi:hypothetical protein
MTKELLALCFNNLCCRTILLYSTAKSAISGIETQQNATFVLEEEVVSERVSE